MSQTAVALLALAALISVGHWAWARAAAQVNLRLFRGHSRRHVLWLMANASYVHVVAALLAVSAVGAQLGGA